MNIFDMIKNVKTIQSDLAGVEATGRTGADMVVVTLNGKFEVKKLSISSEVLTTHDSTVVSELVKAAFNDAVRKVQQEIQHKIGASGAGAMIGNIFGNNGQ